MEKTISQSTSYEATGTLDRDISDILTNITPDKTPFFSMLHVGPEAREMAIEWHTDELRPARKNMRPELDEYTNIKKAGGVYTDKNFIQIFREDGMVSDIMQRVDKTYNPKKDELGRQKIIKMKEIAKDIEYAIMVNADAHAENGVNPPMMGGIPYFMNEKTISVTINIDSSTPNYKVVASSAHGLVDGNYVVFKAGTDGLPPELEANQRYYVKLDTTTPSTTFTVYNEFEDAIEGQNQITFTLPTGVTGVTSITASILLNNVISAEDHLFTEHHINNAMELAYYRGGNPTYAVMSPSNRHRFTEIMNKVNTTNRNQSDKRVTEVVSVYESDFGTLSVMSHRECANNSIYLLDLDYWKIRYLDRPHIISQPELGKSGSYEKFVVTGALSLEGTQPLASARISNIKRPPKTVSNS